MKKVSLGILLLSLILLFSLLFGEIGPFSATERLLSPTFKHIFGTDADGRDIFSLSFFSLRISFIVGFSSSFFSVLLGLFLSFLFSLRSGGKTLVYTILDSFKAVPAVVLALFFGSLGGQGTLKIIAAIIIAQTPNIARSAYARAPVLRKETFSLASEAAGKSEVYIFINHILPRIILPLLIQGVGVFSSAVLTEASLSYLGCGVPLTTPSLGRMLSLSRSVALSAWWTALFPSLLLLILSLSLNLIVFGLSDFNSSPDRS